MGETPRLLAEDEKETLAAELQSLPPADRLARIGDLRRRHGEHYEALAAELTGRVDRGAGLLLGNVGDAPLAGMLARGMEKAEGTPRRTAAPHRLPPRLLPKTADGKTDIGALDPAYDYRIPDGRGETIARPEGNALVPVAVGEPGLDGAGPGADRAKQIEERIKTAPGMTDEAFRRLQLDIARAGLTATQMVRLQNAAQDVRTGKLDPEYVFSEQREKDRATESSSTVKSVPRGAIDAAALALGPEVLGQRLKRNQIRTIGLLIQGLAGADEATLHETLRIIHRAPNLTRVDRTFLSRTASDVRRGRLKPEDVPEYVAQAEKGWAAGAQGFLRQFGAETFPIPPEHEENLSVKVGRGIGGASVLLAARLLTGVPGAVVTAASMGSGEAIERAIAAGAMDDEQKQAALLGAAIGLTDMVPIERLLRPVRHIPGMEGALYAITRKAVEQGAIEASQEAAQALMQNMVAALAYAPDQDLTEGVAENGLVGFLVGALFGAGAGTIRTARDGSGASPNLDVSAAERVIDDDQIAGYAEFSLHENFREPERPYAEPGQAGHNAFGLIDPESDKPIIQPINDVERMLAMADEDLQPLTQQLKEIVADVPGVQFSGARVKGRDRLDEKLATGRRPDTLGDYLGGRIVVDDPAMLGEAVRVLTSRYQSVEVDYFIKEPRETGYRAVHVQVVLDDGMTAEIQIMPREILAVYEKDHKNYEKWRNKTDLTPEEAREKEADASWAQNAYDKAYTHWLQRAYEPHPQPIDR